MTLRVGTKELKVVYSRRDLKVLRSRSIPEGKRFIIAMGVWDNFTVADGQDTKAWTTRPRLEALRASRKLLRVASRDRALLECDYAYCVGKNKNWRQTTSGIEMNGRPGLIHAGPGELSARLMRIGARGRGVFDTLIDLRGRGRYVNDHGEEIRVRRNRKELGWTDSLPHIITFLEDSRASSLKIRHHQASTIRSSK
jgi:hypothetical protein